MPKQFTKVVTACLECPRYVCVDQPSYCVSKCNHPQGQFNVPEPWMPVPDKCPLPDAPTAKEGT